MFLIRLVRDNQPTGVGHVLAERQLAVYVYTVRGLLGACLCDKRLGFFSELLFVNDGPPLFHIALGVKLGALVVKAVRNLVPDDRADARVVDRRVGARVKKRPLQYRRGEDDVVEVRSEERRV